VLAVSGRLNRTMGGRGFFPKLSSEVLETESRPGFGWGESSSAEQSRRSIYIYHLSQADLDGPLSGSI